MEYKSLKSICCAGIVLYNPEMNKLVYNINSIYDQVDSLVLIDNASENIELVEDLAKKYNNITIVKNKCNYGVARALNQILEFAHINGYEWYLSLDQDSYCAKNLIFEYASNIINDSSVAILSPYILNNGKVTLAEYRNMNIPSVEVIKQPTDCITSGSLNRVEAALKISGYNEKLFIDCVDIDFNLRLSILNYKILRVNTTYMVQSMGKAKSVKIFKLLYSITKLNMFKRIMYTPVYNDIRIYYIARNSRYIHNKYGNIAGIRMSILWMKMQFLYYILTYPMSRSRIKMLSSIHRGITDSKFLY